MKIESLDDFHEGGHRSELHCGSKSDVKHPVEESGGPVGVEILEQRLVLAPESRERLQAHRHHGNSQQHRGIVAHTNTVLVKCGKVDFYQSCLCVQPDRVVDVSTELIEMFRPALFPASLLPLVALNGKVLFQTFLLLCYRYYRPATSAIGRRRGCAVSTAPP